MEELIFFAVIILFSILESVARSKKKKAEGGAPEVPGEWPGEDEEAWRPERSGRGVSTLDAPTYDTEPSYDEVGIEESASRETLERYPETYRTSSRGAGSEGMIPTDIWEEIAGLAQGSKPRRSEPTVPVPRRRRVTTAVSKRVEPHRVHLSHSGYGTDPSERAPSAQDDLDPLARRLSADVRLVRAQLLGGRHALRQAVILSEVLGPPASLRSEGVLE